MKKILHTLICIMSLDMTNAQIIYTDVIPDSTMNCDGNGSCTKDYNLDLNNDSNNDFIITASHFYSAKKGIGAGSDVSANPLNGNAVKDTLVNTINVSIPLQFNAVIGSNLLLNQSWQTSGPQSLKSGIYGGDSGDMDWGLWDSLSDYYLGLRILQSGQTHYGWVRLRVDITQSFASLIVRDYAYNSIPNQAILTGQTTATGILENSFASSINLFPNPANNHLTIALGNINKKVDVTILDITGKIIYTSTTRAPESYRAQKIDVNTKDFAAGVYTVLIQTGDFISTKKLLVEK